MCKKSPYVIDLLEEFELEDKLIYITKLERGGDLATFCKKYQKLNDNAEKEGWLSIK